MKRVVGAFAVTALSLSLVACSGDDDDSPDDIETETEIPEIETETEIPGVDAPEVEID